MKSVVKKAFLYSVPCFISLGIALFLLRDGALIKGFLVSNVEQKLCVPEEQEKVPEGPQSELIARGGHSHHGGHHSGHRGTCRPRWDRHRSYYYYDYGPYYYDDEEDEDYSDDYDDQSDDEN